MEDEGCDASLFNLAVALSNLSLSLVLVLVVAHPCLFSFPSPRFPPPLQLGAAGDSKVELTFKRGVMVDLLGVAVSTAKAHEWESKTPGNGSSSNGKLPPKSPKLTPVKIITVGDAGVGKTRLLARFAAEKDLEPKATVGVEALTKKVTLAGGRTIKAQMWDTAGQERYRAITRAHFRRAHCTTLVYDITRKDTLDHAKQWLDELRTEAPDTIILLVGNKSDLVDQRAVTKEQGEKFARDNGIVAKDGTPLHIETSALQPDTVFKAFDVLFRGERRGGK